MKPNSMIAFILFTHGADADCLRESVTSIRTAYRGAPVAIFDDHRCRVSPVPRCEMLGVTAFNRRGNLNGRECLLGMLACMSRVAAKTGAKWICKVDSDTILNRQPNRPLDSYLDGYALAGSGVHAASVLGPCYAVRASALPDLTLAALSTPDLVPPEDAAITQCAINAGFRVNVIPAGGGWLSKFNYREPAEDVKYRACVAVSFGNRNQLRCAESVRRERVARAMRDFMWLGLTPEQIARHAMR